jgi:YegS/Rv2252/BmrU family lipid kinase
MRAFVVVNPAAGNGTTRARVPSIRQALAAAGVVMECVETDGPGRATELAAGAARRGWPLVVAVGGDGTINEVVNGLIDDNGQARATLGIVNTGRGRDACRNLAIPAGEAAAVARLCHGAERRVDLGVVEAADRRRYFVNAAGAGFDAAVAERARSRRGTGTVPYLLAVLGALRRHRPRLAAIAVDGTEPREQCVTAVVVANGAWYGGGMKIAPAAHPADGLLDVVVLGALGRLALLRWLPTVYGGGHLACPDVTTARARTVTITAPQPLAVHADGEPAGRTPLCVRVLPGALRVRG